MRVHASRGAVSLAPISGTGLLSGHDRRGRTLGQMAREISAREQALRRLPLPYSLAPRRRHAGVAPDVVCEEFDVAEDS